MDELPFHELKQIASVESTACASIYLPTHPAITFQQDAVSLKSLLDRLEGQIDARSDYTHALLPSIKTLRQVSSQSTFWSNRSRALVVFMEPERIRQYRLPITIDAFAIASDRFHITPVLQLFNSQEKFYILTLGQHRVRLFEMDLFSIQPVLIDLPQGIDETLNLQSEDRGSQTHFGVTASDRSASAVFHGHGGKKDTHKKELQLFCQEVNAGLMRFLRQKESTIILAGVDYLVSIFRKVCNYSKIAVPKIEGNWDHASAAEIHELAIPIVARILSDQRQCLIESYNNAKAHGLTTESIAAALPAASAGRIETLFIDCKKHIWGTFVSENGPISLHNEKQPHDDDLLDALAANTLLNGGQCLDIDEIELPSSSAFAAQLRF